MKILSIVAIFVVPILIGVVLRIFVRKKPKTELVIWGILMAAILFFFIYGLILVINQETPLFTKNHLGNEFSVISSTIFLILGIIYFRNIKKSTTGKHNEIENSEKNYDS